jgi:hypothetical protein
MSMTNPYSVDDLLDFLDHAGDRGLLPVATAQALAVASRNVLGVLTEDEKQDLGRLDLDGVIKRFSNKRAKEINPRSLTEYGRRVHRAVELLRKWRDDPANFAIKTRTTAAARKKGRVADVGGATTGEAEYSWDWGRRAGTYQSSLPIRPGLVITLANVPHDLTRAEAERIADFVRMLAVVE